VALPDLVIFVHGWSVTSTDTYGEFPERLVAEAKKAGWALQVKHVFLGKYVSFRDEVTVDDIVRGFENAIRTELGAEITAGKRCACITHSTGGPVVRAWWHRFYQKPSNPPVCPVSHLIMLAPANFGSALAQLGKDRVGRIKAWFSGVEPGQGVLNWLELGSPESWELNKAWVKAKKDFSATNGVFPFVLTGELIDRKLYDHVNSYTGEPGSDGVVRAAAANLNATFLRLVQQTDDGSTSRLEVEGLTNAPDTAFKIVPGRAHSGSDMGILRSVKNDAVDHPSVEAVMRCLKVDSAATYFELASKFEDENVTTQQAEQVDIQKRRLLPDAVYIIDKFSMVTVVVRDDQGNQVGDFDLKLTGIPADAPEAVKSSPDLLPSGFLQDRQRNKRDNCALTFYLNQSLMGGTAEVRHPKNNEVLRKAQPGLRALGFIIEPHLDEGFVHFVKAELEADKATLRKVLQPNQTTMIEIVMKRVVREGVMRLQRLDKRDDGKFDKTPKGGPIDPTLA
jgi:hypothetical protein